jgi:tetratricopeptide (TPR) repeat protein
LLEGEFDSALEDLRRADELAPSGATKNELGAAYALSGDAHQRNSDYGHALESLLEAVRQEPASTRALFNLALVYERLSMLDKASETWRKLLAIEKEASWANEARTRLEEVEKKQSQRQGALEKIPDDPAVFLAVSKNGEYDAENLQNTFWSRWLPDARRDAAASRAATSAGSGLGPALWRPAPDRRSGTSRRRRCR